MRDIVSLGQDGPAQYPMAEMCSLHPDACKLADEMREFASSTAGATRGSADHRQLKSAAGHLKSMPRAGAFHSFSIDFH